MDWDLLYAIGGTLLAFGKLFVICWVILFLFSGLIGLIMDPYYGLPEDKHRKKLLAKRKKKEN